MFTIHGGQTKGIITVAFRIDTFLKEILRIFILNAVYSLDKFTLCLFSRQLVLLRKLGKCGGYDALIILLFHDLAVCKMSKYL